jgi:hypothetical protein
MSDATTRDLVEQRLSGADGEAARVAIGCPIVLLPQQERPKFQSPTRSKSVASHADVAIEPC